LASGIASSLSEKRRLAAARVRGPVEWEQDPLRLRCKRRRAAAADAARPGGADAQMAKEAKDLPIEFKSQVGMSARPAWPSRLWTPPGREKPIAMRRKAGRGWNVH